MLAREEVGKMKTNIEIQKAEVKTAEKTGKPYWRFQTSEGWISVFQKPIADKLMENVGKIVEAEMTENKNGDYVNKNITAFYKVIEDAKIVEEIVKNPAIMTAKTARPYEKDPVGIAAEIFIEMMKLNQECKEEKQ